MKKKLRPNKNLGQHFLSNEFIKKKIIDSCDITPSDTVLEIGAGNGAITRLISKQAKNVIAVEIDKELCRTFLIPEFTNTNVKVINSDILKFDFKSLGKGVKIIGNIPYNISTPIIEKVISHKDRFQQFFMTVQLEFGKRLAAVPGSKTYGALSCFAQYHSDIKILFKIKKNAFNPVPKVESCFIELSFPERAKYTPHNEKLFFRIIRSAFEQRRKVIVNSISSIIGKDDLNALLEGMGIDPRSRAENLRIEDYVKISDILNIN